MTYDEALRKLRIMLNSNGRTPEESAVFAAKAQEIMERFKIDASDVNFEAQEKERDAEPIQDYGYEDPLIDKGYGWMTALCGIVANHSGCRTVKRSIGAGRYTVRIFGRPSDVQTVRYLTGYLIHEVKRLSSENCKGNSSAYINQFNIGAVIAIRETLNAQRKATHDAIRLENSANPLALVRVNNAIVKQEKHAMAVQAFLESKVKGLRAGRGMAQATGATIGGRQQGYEAGKSIRINRASGALGNSAKQLN